MALGLWLCARATYVADLSAFLPSAPTAEQRVLLAQLKSGATARVLMIGVRGGEPAQRADASRRLAAALRTSGAFESVHNGDRAGGDEVAQKLFARRYLLSPGVDDQRFTVAGLRDAMQDTVALLGTPAGSLLKPVLWRDPTGEAVRLVEAMQPAIAPRTDDGVWVSRTLPRAVLLATTRADGEDLDAQAQAQSVVRERFEALGMPGLSLDLSGPGVFAVDARATIRGGGRAPVRHRSHRDAGHPAAGLRFAGPAGHGGPAGGQWRGRGHCRGQPDVRPGPWHHARVRGHADRRSGRLRHLLPGAGARARQRGAGGASTGRRCAWACSRRWRVSRPSWSPVSMACSNWACSRWRACLPRAAPRVSCCRCLRRRAPRASALRTRLGEWARPASRALPAWRLPLSLLTVAAVVALLLHASPWRGTLATLSPVQPQALALDASLRADLGAADVGDARGRAGERRGRRLARRRSGRRAPGPAGRRGRPAGLPVAQPPPAQPATAARAPGAPAGRRRPSRTRWPKRPRQARCRPPGSAPSSTMSQAQRKLPPLTRADLQGTPLAGALDAQLIRGRDGGVLDRAAQPAAVGPPSGAVRRHPQRARRPARRARDPDPARTGCAVRGLHAARALAGAAPAAWRWSPCWPGTCGRRRGSRACWRRCAASVVLVLAGLTLAGVAAGHPAPGGAAAGDGHRLQLRAVLRPPARPPRTRRPTRSPRCCWPT